MKTTVTISDLLLDDARKLAEREGVALDALVERGLSRVFAESNRDMPFKLRRASFKGAALEPNLVAAPWDSPCELSYEGRGGLGRPPY